MNADAVAPATAGFADLTVEGRTLRLEFAWIGEQRSELPLFVFLHEGLGSAAMWKDFPQAFCAAAGARGLVYSRAGYGRSTPRPTDEKWPVDFMHGQAHHVLPALFSELRVAEPVWLFGHSDGGSIALLFAAAFPERVEGAIVVSPHVFVEDLSIASIEEARTAYAGTDLRAKLARYHDDPDSAFFGWNDIWLDPAFRSWNIVSCLAQIRAPVLAVQGKDDQYGTMAQVETIVRHVARGELCGLPDCGHSPHRDQPALLMDAAVAFVRAHRRTAIRAS